MVRMTMVGAAAIALAATGAGAAQAAELVLEDVVGRVEVITEDRADIAVEARPGRQLPAPRVTRAGERVSVAGDPRRRIRNCNQDGGVVRVEFADGERVELVDGPVVTVRAPRSLSVVARGGAVSGRVGAAQDLHIRSGGCAAMTVADVSGTLRLEQSGGASVRAGDVRVGRFAVSGGGNVSARSVSDLQVNASGGGIVRIGRINGPANLDASGGAQVNVEGGRAGLLRAHASGAGVVRYGGAAERLDASASGVSRIRIAQVTGQILRRSASSMSSITIGR